MLFAKKKDFPLFLKKLFHSYCEDFMNKCYFDADILLATDPDSDRVGVAIKNNGTASFNRDIIFSLLSLSSSAIVILALLSAVSPEVIGQITTPIMVKTYNGSKERILYRNEIV